MRQFIYGSDSAYQALQHISQANCVVFHYPELPATCQPSMATRIGFEMVGSEAVVLMIDPVATIHYTGRSLRLRQLLEQGELRFEHFAALTEFMRGELRAEFESGQTHATPVQHSSVASCSLPVLTDAEVAAAALEIQLAQAQRPAWVDAEALQAALNSQVLGQPQAVRMLSRVAANHLAKRNPQRPATVFLIGCTGVGKTKAVLSLAAAISQVGGNEYGFLRLDMCEYQEPHRVSMLFGSPQGYAGYGDHSALISQLANQPRSIILFDEIEKAHKDIFKALMNAMDSGRISSSAPCAGKREIDCRQAMFTFTSNLAADELLASLTCVQDEFNDERALDQTCRIHLLQHGILPELCGRICHFAVFYPLDIQARVAILAQAVAHIGLEEYGIEVIRIEPDAIVVLAGEDSGELGVRPNEHWIDHKLGDSFARAAHQGHTRVTVRANPLRVEPALVK